MNVEVFEMNINKKKLIKPFRRIFGCNMNNIQEKIFVEYFNTGTVWGEFPRQCGKTTILKYIAMIEFNNIGSVCIKSKNASYTKEIIKSIIKELPDFNVVDEHDAKVILCDEMYYDTSISNRGIPYKVLSLRTTPHKVLRCDWDASNDSVYQKNVEKHKDANDDESFSIQYEPTTYYM